MKKKKEKKVEPESYFYVVNLGLALSLKIMAHNARFIYSGKLSRWNSLPLCTKVVNARV